MSNLKTRLEKEPFNLDLRQEYAVSLLEEKSWENGLQQFELLLSQNHKNASVYCGAAICLHKLKRPEEALEKYGLAKKYDDFKTAPELEELSGSAKAAGPQLQIIENRRAPRDQKVVDIFSSSDYKIGFRDIVGMEALKKTIRLQIIEPFYNPGIFAKFKKKAGGGILLYGPPGCGKTMMARAIATEVKASYYSVGISDVLNMWIGESEKNLSELFEKARANKPAVLFFDELDALAFSRSKAQSEHSRTIVNEFLAQMDGINSDNDQLLVIAASNMPWDIDPAMKRPGRFDRQIFISPPDQEARERMFQMKLTDIPTEKIDYAYIAKLTPHCSGADIDGIIDKAKESVLGDIIERGVERNLTRQDLTEACKDYRSSTMDWLRTARNLVKYGGADDSYRDVESYLKSVKFI